MWEWKNNLVSLAMTLLVAEMAGVPHSIDSLTRKAIREALKAKTSSTLST